VRADSTPFCAWERVLRSETRGTKSSFALNSRVPSVDSKNAFTLGHVAYEPLGDWHRVTATGSRSAT